MSCWKSSLERWKREVVTPDLSGMDDLFKSLTSSRAMSAGALADLLRRDVPGFKVQTRIAVNGHDVEYQDESGLWVVLNPLELEASKQPSDDLLNQIRNQRTREEYFN